MFHTRSLNLDGVTVQTNFVSLEHVVYVIGDVAGVHLHELSPFTTLLVSTRNSSYRLIVTSGSNVYVQGGTLFTEPTAAFVDGSTIGSTLLRVGWIGVGFGMEIRAGGRVIATSPVRAITTERPDRSTQQ
jgi:hypothetical protein